MLTVFVGNVNYYFCPIKAKKKKKNTQELVVDESLGSLDMQLPYATQEEHLLQIESFGLLKLKQRIKASVTRFRFVSITPLVEHNSFKGSTRYMITVKSPPPAVPRNFCNFKRLAWNEFSRFCALNPQLKIFASFSKDFPLTTDRH